MFDLRTIQAMNREHAARAAKEGRLPYIVWAEDLDNMPPFPFPNLGNYVPDGWKLDKEYFVDSSGFGQEGEPALTIDQFLKVVEVGKGYALTECGQFQLYVGEYTKL